jgi:hypothetical protein
MITQTVNLQIDEPTEDDLREFETLWTRLVQTRTFECALIGDDDKAKEYLARLTTGDLQELAKASECLATWCREAIS